MVIALGILLGLLVGLFAFEIVLCVFYSRSIEFQLYKKLREKADLEKKIYYQEKINKLNEEIDCLQYDLYILDGYEIIDNVEVED